MIPDMEALNDREKADKELAMKCQEPELSQYRTLSGFCNNLEFPVRGRAGRSTFSVLSGPLLTPEQTGGLPNPRLISSVVCNEDGETATPGIFPN